jgi:lipoate-protein ligase B
MKHHTSSVTGYKTNTPQHRLKSVQYSLRKQGYICSARLTAEGKPYIQLTNNYKITFQAKQKAFKLKDPRVKVVKVDGMDVTFYGPGWKVATEIVAFLQLPKDAPGMFDENFNGYHYENI